MRSLQCQDAVSSVVGTVLILAITVSTFGAFALVVMREVEDSPASPAVDLQVQSVSGQFLVKHRGGDSLPVGLVTLHVTDGTTRHAFPLTEFASLGDTWDIGESIVVSDVFSGDVKGIEVITTAGGRSTMLAAAGAPVTAASAPTGPAPVGGGPEPDLTISSVTSTSLVVGEPTTFEALVANSGGAAGASSVRFEILEGPDLVWSETAAAAPIGASGTLAVASPPWKPTSGTFTLYVAADNEDTVAESDEGNNEWTSQPFSPVASGTTQLAYVDVDDDGAFTPGLDEQVQVGTLTAGDCAGRVCVAGDLGYVVADPGDGSTPGFGLWPQSIQATVDVYLGAPGGVAAPDSTITTTGNQMGIRLVAGGGVRLGGATLATDGNQDGVTVEAGAGITATSATVQGSTLVFTASAEIGQDGLSLLDRTGAPHTGATNTNNSCVRGTLAQGAWAMPPSVCP